MKPVKRSPHYHDPGGPFYNPKKTRPLPSVPPLVRQEQILIFSGYHNGVLAHTFQTMCGPQPPTITSAPATISVVDRPRSLGYTVPTGYDPITMDVQLRFDNWVDYSGPLVNQDLELDLARLWWMAGRGTLGPGRPTTGNPPTIEVSSINSAGILIPLVPPQVRNVKWYISNIAWDTAPMRFTSEMIAARDLSVAVATRGRQDVTVTLQQVQDQSGLRSARKKPDNGSFYRVSDSQYRNVKLMCAYYLNRRDQTTYKAVMQLPANKHLHLTDPGKRLKNGTKLYFPNSLKAE
jgi:hypothetical protein